MGGWTRIWVVLTVVTCALAAWGYVDSTRYAEQRANSDYGDALRRYDNCRHESETPEPAPSGNSPFDKYLAQQPGSAKLSEPLVGPCAGTDIPREQYAQKQAQQRDDSLAMAKRDAVDVLGSIVAWVSGTVGALFLAVGWIRRGFRRKTRT